MPDTQPAMAYPTEEQYERWKVHAAEMDMSVSQFMQAMVEAGRRKFEVDVEPDQTNQELREQRNDLKRELEKTRSRVEQLEDRLHNGERSAIRRFVEENPGATHAEIMQHIANTVPERAIRHIDDLEGEHVRVENDRYYPIGEQ